MTAPIQRKLTTIMAADAAGYSSQMERDEVGTMQALRRAREVFFRHIDVRGGRVANTAGDGLIAEFPSVVEAVTAAIEIQRELRDTHETLPFRIGLHLGDVIVDGDDLLGEGVNLAARLESMADPGGILLSQQVYDHVHSKLSIGFEFIGDQRPRHFSEDVPVYRVAGEGGAARMAAFARTVSKAVPRPQEGAPSRAPSGDLPQLVKGLGVAWLFLLVVDLASGKGFFSHWTAIPLLGVLGFFAVPRFAPDERTAGFYRLGVVCVLLVLINLFSWAGTFWAIYPAAAFAAMTVLRMVRRS